MPPSSYQAATRGDHAADPAADTKSQTLNSNLSHGQSTVAMLLEKKDATVVTASPGQTISDVVVLLRDNGIGAVVVTGDDGAVQGILSERDIVRRMADTPGRTLPQAVADLMTREVQTCTPDDLLVDLLRRMTAGGFRHMPVLDEGPGWPA